jgi:hypothetical protein
MITLFLDRIHWSLEMLMIACLLHALWGLADGA